MKKYTTIDEYIEQQPKDTQIILQKIRKTIKSLVPEATEAISYGIPTFKLNGNLVHFAGYKEHVGFYPAPQGINKFKKELAKYQSGKGTIKFPITDPIPYDLIAKVVKFRVEQNTKS